jgi:hypothetical protein
VAIVAVADVDYANPTATVYFEEEWKYSFSVDVLTSYDTPWEISLEICFLQNGVKVGEVKINGVDVTGNKYELNNGVSLNKFYDENGGDLSVVINRLSLRRMPK